MIVKIPKLFSTHYQHNLKSKTFKLIFLWITFDQQWHYDYSISADQIKINPSRDQSILIENIIINHQSDPNKTENRNQLQAHKLQTKNLNQDINLEQFYLDFTTLGLNAENALYLYDFFALINENNKDIINDFFEVFNQKQAAI